LRGELHRQAEARQIDVLFDNELTYLRLQSHLRGVLIRRIHRAQEEKISDAADVVVAVQAVCRGVLARRRKLDIVRAIADALPVSTLTSIQACARAKLARQSHQTMRKVLAKVEVASSVGGLQAFLRSRLAKKQTQEQKKKLEFVSPDVVGVQAQARGYLARQEYREWRDHLHDPHTQGALVFLQSIMRGYIARRNLFTRLYEYKMNEHNVVKIQAIWRGRWERRLYERLMAGASNDIDVPTIQNFMHLLNDTERDFSDQIRIEELRRDVMGLVRDNQALEGEVQELETKIALIAKNKMTIEELHRVKRHARGTAMGNGAGDEFSIHGQGDPFSGQYLDKAGQRKLELYEQLFFTLQTKPEYLVRLIRELEAQGEDGERDKGLVKAVVLSLFRRGEERREEYMFHRFLQVCQSRPWGACRVTVVYRGPRTCRCHWQMSADCPAFCTHRDARLTLARDATADPIPLTRARHFLPQRRPHYVLANDHDAMYRRSRL
jgi:Ras GTPase-activating-like protein IQGAP2/3